MLEKEDLQAIAELIDEKLAASEARIVTGTDAKLTAMEQRIKQDTMVMMEQYFEPKFNLLAENQQLILEKLDTKVDKESCESGMTVVAAAIRAHSRDIEELQAK